VALKDFVFGEQIGGKFTSSLCGRPQIPYEVQSEKMFSYDLCVF
jgi:hypothetical protein